MMAHFMAAAMAVVAAMLFVVLGALQITSDATERVAQRVSTDSAPGHSERASFV